MTYFTQSPSGRPLGIMLESATRLYRGLRVPTFFAGMSDKKRRGIYEGELVHKEAFDDDDLVWYRAAFDTAFVDAGYASDGARFGSTVTLSVDQVMFLQPIRQSWPTSFARTEMPQQMPW